MRILFGVLGLLGYIVVIIRLCDERMYKTAAFSIAVFGISIFLTLLELFLSKKEDA